MTAEHSSEEGGEGLSEAEREALVEARVHDRLSHPDATTCTEALIERILADRLAAVQAERDDLRGRLAAGLAVAKKYETWEVAGNLRVHFVHDLRAALANPSAAQGDQA